VRQKTESYLDDLFSRLRTVEEIVSYLEACLETEDSEVLKLGVQDILNANEVKKQSEKRCKKY